MKYLLAGILLIASLSGFAAVYMQTDSHGQVIYSDTPSNNAQAINLPSGNNSVSVAPQDTTGTNADSTKSSTKEGAKEYTRFEMISPSNQQTFQNQRDIPVVLQLEPNLREGDKIQVYLDDSPAGPPTTDISNIYVRQVDRGQHSIYAVVMDNGGHLLNKVDPVTVYIHYSAIPTGSGAIPATDNQSGVTPSSPGGGVTTPASQGTGIIPPGGSGIVPSGGGNGVTPPASSGSGIVPPSRY